MYPLYEDIIRRLGEPRWYDENGVPRYDKFHPCLCDIYAEYAALMQIECQSCRKKFLVADTWSMTHDGLHGDVQWDANGKNGQPKGGLPTRHSAGGFDYGDAPWHTVDGRQCSGTTMTSELLAVMEFWARNLGKLHDWVRMAEHEVVFAVEE